MADLPEPGLWHDSETGHWSRLTRPSRPTYEAYYTADQLRTYAAAQVAEAVAAEREGWKGRAIAACHSAGDGPENGCCPTYWEDAREACIAAIQKA
jgi:hypothetical protein